MNFKKGEPRSTGTLLKRADVQKWEKDIFKILSIDGGGIRGILPACFLRNLENKFLKGEPIGNHFDMLVGTSTGGIISLGLGYGYSAKEIFDFYIEQGPFIFKGHWWRQWFSYVRTGYNEENLIFALKDKFGNHKFGDIKKPTVIPALEGKYGQPAILKQSHPRYTNDRNYEIVEVARMTTAAPSYFSAFSKDGYDFFDGGIFANNPIMNGVADAISSFDIDLSQIRVLSLGCGKSMPPLSKFHHRLGRWFWGTAFANSSIASQSNNATGQARIMIGGDKIIRVDTKPMDNLMKLDDFKRASKELPDIANKLMTEKEFDQHNEDYQTRIYNMFLK